MTIKDTNVLVVEDDSPTLQCERLILEGGGYRVVWAANGEEAINMVADLSPDLVLLDIGLPGIDGFTTCKVIRRFSQVPIIMVTGSNASTDKVRGLDLGADDYITKPFSEAELFARASAVLRRSATGHQAVQGVSSLEGEASRRPSPVNFTNNLRSCWVLFRRWQQSLAGSIKGRLALGYTGGFSRWLALQSEARLFLGRTGRYLLARVIVLATFCRAIARRAGNSLRAGRVKAIRPAMRLADAAARLLESGAGKKARHAGSRLWTGWRFHLTRLLASYNNRRQAGPLDRSIGLDYGEQDSRHPQTAPLLHPSLPGGVPMAGVARKADQTAFLEELLGAYLKVAGIVCRDPLISAPVVPLVGVYEQMVSSVSMDDGYSQKEFARDVYYLHRSGIDTTPTGARVQFSISRGVSNKTLVLANEAGQEVRYYGIRFLPARRPDRENPPQSRAFDILAADRYGVEIREVFARQLEWPTEEFVQFWAGQINLGALGQKEARQMAQITRDSLQQFINELR